MALDIVRHDYNGLAIPQVPFDLMIAALDGDSSPFAIPSSIEGLAFVESGKKTYALLNGRTVNFSDDKNFVSKEQMLEEVWMDALAERIRQKFCLPARQYTPSGWVPYSTPGFLSCSLERPDTPILSRVVDFDDPRGASQIPAEEWGKDPFAVSKYLARFSKKKDLSGYLYVIGDDSSAFVKIGYSANPYQRLKKLQAASSKSLGIIHEYKSSNARELERFVHNELSIFRSSGEWFCRKATLKNLPKVIKKWESI